MQIKFPLDSSKNDNDNSQAKILQILSPNNNSMSFIKILSFLFCIDIDIFSFFRIYSLIIVGNTGSLLKNSMSQLKQSLSHEQSQRVLALDTSLKQSVFQNYSKLRGGEKNRRDTRNKARSTIDDMIEDIIHDYNALQGIIHNIDNYLHFIRSYIIRFIFFLIHILFHSY